MTAAGIAYVAYFVLAIMGAATASAPLSVLGTAVYFVLAIFLYRSFWRADLDEAAKRLGAILDEEQADVLTVYDEHGGYGHPDHIQVHRVGVRAAELAGTRRVYEATANRDAIVRGLLEARSAGMEMPGNLDPDAMDDFGVGEDQITTEVDVTDYLDRKRAAMAAHASQISESSFFLAMPPDFFARAFGTEWFIRRGAPAGIHEHGLLDDLE